MGQGRRANWSRRKCRYVRIRDVIRSLGIYPPSVFMALAWVASLDRSNARYIIASYASTYINIHLFLPTSVPAEAASHNHHEEWSSRYKTRERRRSVNMQIPPLRHTTKPMVRKATDPPATSETPSSYPLATYLKTRITNVEEWIVTFI